MTEDQLLERLKLIENLYSGAATEGEKNAASNARERIKKRLEQFVKVDPPQEYSFSLQDPWSRKLFIALLRRYDIKPFRYPRQRRTTVMAKVSQSFVEEVLWPEFEKLSSELQSYLSEVTNRVIKESIHKDTSEIIEKPKHLR